MVTQIPPKFQKFATFRVKSGKQLANHFSNQVFKLERLNPARFARPEVMNQIAVVNQMHPRIVTAAAAGSRPARRYAHYCSINSSERRPRIIPLITEDGITIPPQIVKVVYLPFREIQYDSDFERLLSALGLEQSPFASAKELEVTISRGGREFDVQREAEIFAAALIRQHPQVSSVFDKLSAEARAAAGRRWLRWFGPSPHALVWEDMTYRKSRQPQFVRVSEFTILVFFPLRSGHSSGYESGGRVVLDIAAFDERKYDHVGGDEMTLVLHSHTLRLKFEGFRDVNVSHRTHV